MKSRFKHIDIIEKYLSGELSGLEQALFEKELKTSKRLANEFSEYKTLISAIRDQEAIKLRKQLKIIFTYKHKHYQKNHLIQTSRIKILRYAAILIIMITLCVIIILEIYNGKLTQNKVLNFLATDTAVFNSDSLAINPLRPINKIVPDSIHYRIKKKSIAPDTIIEDSIDITNLLGESLGDNYKLDLTWSELIFSSYRSANFFVEEPLDSSIYKKNDIIPFRWESNIKNNLFLEILDNKGKIKIRVPLENKNHYYLENTLGPGIYIVKFRTDNDLLEMRVFFVF
jgi:hypothetical protein